MYPSYFLVDPCVMYPANLSRWLEWSYLMILTLDLFWSRYHVLERSIYWDALSCKRDFWLLSSWNYRIFLQNLLEALSNVLYGDWKFFIFLAFLRIYALLTLLQVVVPLVKRTIWWGLWLSSILLPQIVLGSRNIFIVSCDHLDARCFFLHRFSLSLFANWFSLK